MSDDSSTKILEWLRRAGYPLEVRVGRHCRDRDWLTYHEFPYTDPVEGKLRTCDVYTGRTRRHRDGSAASIELAIECKRSADKPWVVFAEPIKAGDWFLPSTLAPGRVAVECLTMLEAEHQGIEFLRPQGRVGYSITKTYANTKEGDPSAAYSALRSALSAAEAIALSHEQGLLEEPSILPPIVAITLPVVVVGAPLYLYTTGGHGEERLEQITVAKVVAPQRSFESRCLLTVTTEEAFADWLALLTAWADPVLVRMKRPARGHGNVG